MDYFNPIIGMREDAKRMNDMRKREKRKKSVRRVFIFTLIFFCIFAYAGMTSKSAQAAESDLAVLFVVKQGIASLPIRVLQPAEDRKELYAHLVTYAVKQGYDPTPDTIPRDGCSVEVVLGRYSAYCQAKFPSGRSNTDAQMLDSPQQVIKFIRNFSGRYYQNFLRQMQERKPSINL